MSFDADERFPDMANVLEIRSDEEDGRKRIVAKRDIDVGQIVMLEEMYITNNHSEMESFCKTCLRSAMNFIPCRNCKDVMFCDDSCMASHKVHEMTCNALKGQTFDYIRIAESILMAATAFPDVATLMGFVESGLATRDLGTPKCNTDAQRKYRAFLKLKILDDRLQEEMDRLLSLSYPLLFDIPEIEQRFRSTREKRFLMHLIMQHQLIFISNGALFHETDYETGAKQYEVSGLCLSKSHLSHSCIPNVCYQRHGTQIYVYAVRPVKEGDELSIDSGKKELGSQCKCNRCVPIWKQADVDRLKSEQDFRDIMESKMNDVADAEKRPILKAKFENLLRKYGPLPWTPEIYAISEFYDHCMRSMYFI